MSMKLYLPASQRVNIEGSAQSFLMMMFTQESLLELEQWPKPLIILQNGNERKKQLSKKSYGSALTCLMLENCLVFEEVTRPLS